MKEIRELNKAIVWIDGTPIENLTIKNALRLLLAGWKNCPAGRAVRAFELAMKIGEAKDTIQFDDSDFEIVKEAVDSNSSGYVAFIFGQIKKQLIDCDVKPKEEDKKS